MPRGGLLPPTPVLAPGSALGSRPRVALSSGQVTSVYRRHSDQAISFPLARAPRLTEAVTDCGLFLDLFASAAGSPGIVQYIYN
jgi:hypothetical protein